MLNELRELIIKKGSTALLTAYEYAGGFNRDQAPILVRLDGWDDFNSVNIETEPKLVGMGSFIVGKSIGERELTIEINLNDFADIKASLNTFKSHMIAFNDLTIDRVYYTQAKLEKRRERITGIITSIGWERTGTNSTLKLSILCVEPGKRLFIDGSSTPEEGYIL